MARVTVLKRASASKRYCPQLSHPPKGDWARERPFGDQREEGGGNKTDRVSPEGDFSRANGTRSCEMGGRCWCSQESGVVKITGGKHH